MWKTFCYNAHILLIQTEHIFGFLSCWQLLQLTVIVLINIPLSVLLVFVFNFKFQLYCPGGNVVFTIVGLHVNYKRLVFQSYVTSIVWMPSREMTFLYHTDVTWLPKNTATALKFSQEVNSKAGGPRNQETLTTHRHLVHDVMGTHIWSTTIGDKAKGVKLHKLSSLCAMWV